MLRVGLTGGLASGKSFVAEELGRLGCHVFQADQLGRETLRPGGEAYDAVIREFGDAILEPDGSIDRRRLAGEVFSSPERLAVLNSLVHPPVIRREEELIAACAVVDPQGIVVMEAAILIETGSHKRFDRVVLAVCSIEQQIARAIHRDGFTREEVLARLARQMPLDEKRKFAHYVIDTSGTKEQTARQVEETWRSLRSIAQ